MKRRHIEREERVPAHPPATQHAMGLLLRETIALIGLVMIASTSVLACSSKDDASGQGDGGTGNSDGSTQLVDPSCAVDNDSDGYGEGCSRGTDCDDNDPLKGGPEVCDEVDNDCDGETDEFLKDVCIECTAACQAQTLSGSETFNLENGNSGGGLVIDDGVLTLSNSVAPSNALWIANTSDGTVSKLDATTGKELARYPSFIPLTGGPYDECSGGNCRPSRTAIDQEYNAYVANRAFDKQGTVTKYADKEEDCRCTGPAEGSKPCTVITSRDVNDDGVINTSDSAEYPGASDDCILWSAPAGGDADVPRALAIGRREADAAAGWVWVGLNGNNDASKGHKAIALDPDTGEAIDQTTGAVFDPGTGDINDTFVTLTTTNGDYQPYGMATGVDGRIWIAHREIATGSTDRRYALSYIMPGTGFVEVDPIPSDGTTFDAYGIAIDKDGNVYIGNSNAGSTGHHVWRYTTATGAWDGFSAGNISGGSEDTFRKARGVAVDENNVWVTISGNSGWTDKNLLVQYRLKSGATEMFHYNTYVLDPEGDIGNGSGVQGVGPVGVGIAPDRSIWAIAQGTDEGVHIQCSNAACDCVNPGDCTLSHHPVGNNPYTYSDFTGFGLNVFADPGYFRFIVEGCTEGTTDWLGIGYESQGVLPEGSVEFRVRSASSEAAFENMSEADWVGSFEGNPADLTASPGPIDQADFLQVEIQLNPIDPQNPPRISAISVAGACITSGGV